MAFAAAKGGSRHARHWVRIYPQVRHFRHADHGVAGVPRGRPVHARPSVNDL